MQDLMGKKERLTPAVLKALGRKTFPRVLDLPGGAYELARPFKHDFFAATALYKRNDGHAVVLKIGRSADVLGLPARWIGRFLARREARMYQACEVRMGIQPAFKLTLGSEYIGGDHGLEGSDVRRAEEGQRTPVVIAGAAVAKQIERPQRRQLAGRLTGLEGLLLRGSQYEVHVLPFP